MTTPSRKPRARKPAKLDLVLAPAHDIDPDNPEHIRELYRRLYGEEPGPEQEFKDPKLRKIPPTTSTPADEGDRRDE